MMLRIAVLLCIAIIWLPVTSGFSVVATRVPIPTTSSSSTRQDTTTTTTIARIQQQQQQQEKPSWACCSCHSATFGGTRRPTLLLSMPPRSMDDEDDDDDDDNDDHNKDDMEGAADHDDEDDDDDVDIPADWTEDDILAEFEDLEGGDVEEDSDNDLDEEEESEDDDEEEEVVEDMSEDTDEETVIKAAREDDNDDDDDIDEEVLDMDEEEDEDEDEGLTEEFVSEFESDEELLMAAEEEAFEWDEEEDGGNYELMDDPDDPDYMRQKAIVEKAIQEADQRAIDEAFDPIKFVTEEMTPEQAQALDELPFFKEVEARARDLELTEQDVVNSIGDKSLEEAVADISDLMTDDPYPRHEEGEVNILDRNIGLTDDDMENFDKAYKSIDEVQTTEPWDKVMLKDMTGWEGLSNKTLEEMEACLEEIGGSAYNVTKWLLYDLDFNVSNLILAAVKHNREAPILFHHWYPQLVTYERYEHARKRDFDFTWEDVENADMEELERYYRGFGYDEIPKKAPAETGIISLEDLDEEEVKMAAFENWMIEVYNPEWDRKDFDDDDMQDEDNVFSEFYEPPQHPDLPTFDDAVEDIKEWEEEIGDDPAAREYRDKLGRKFEYEVVEDEEFQREFRGHLIVACMGTEKDLDVAEKITLRFEKEFGKKVFVETRVMALAREEDNVFEVWLESYDIELLHSKKRATSNAKGWTGPAEVDEQQIDFLVDRVRFLISDEARYSYRYDFELAE